MRLVGLQRNRYKVIARWLEEELPKVQKRNAVWTALLTHSRLSEVDAKLALKVGNTLPWLDIEDIGGADGMFDPLMPNTISFSKRVAQQFEERPQDAALQAHAEATLLHEMVHWALHKANIGEEGEAGEAFELAAYGDKVLDCSDPARSTASDLGSLSRKYESRAVAGAIGFDSTGGFSYGIYQLASAKGQIKKFLKFLDGCHPTYAAALRDAGGDAAARAGRDGFKQAWKSLSLNDDFARLQHDYIKATHYDPFVAKLKGAGLDISGRSRALKDVAWSISVQHGPGRTSIITRALKKLDAAQRSDDAALIEAIYDERSNVDKYFKSSKPKVKRAVKRRFENERRDALAMLAAA